MSNMMERIEVFQDTFAWIKEDPKLKESISISAEKTQIFYENNYPSFDASLVRDQKVTVSMDRSFQAAMRLRKEHPDSRIAVLNFANAFYPGGGVEAGASAQEECLCRCSTLYSVLNSQYLIGNFYDYHEDLGTSYASDALIYTEGIVICKTDVDLPQRMPEEDWITVDVITCAAPDLSTYSSDRSSGGKQAMSDSALFGFHVKRALHILTAAAAKGADILVTGAFGCGAFRNNPKVVANAWRTALSIFPKVFERVEFAVFCTDEEMENYRVFRDMFAYLEV